MAEGLTDKFTFKNGDKLPGIGLGTWRSPPNAVAAAVAHALKAGYRHIDCAWAYGNEEEVGQGIKDSGVKREEIFITSKLWSNRHTIAKEATLDTLQKLGTSYLDLLLIHWPIPLVRTPADDFLPRLPTGERHVDSSQDLLDTWAQLEALKEEGLVKHIGVSNASQKTLQRFLQGKGVKVVPEVNQIELHPYLPQHSLVKFCKDNGILLEAYSPLGSADSPILSHPDVLSIASKHSISAPNVLISYQLNRGVVPLPKSVMPKRIDDNLNVVKLDEEDMKKLDGLEKTLPEGEQKRFCKPDWPAGLLGFEDWE